MDSHVAITYDAQGPSLPVMTACATSTHAIGEAFHAIKAGYADAIVAGGSEATICPLAIGGFTNCMAGREVSGFDNASAELFRDASMIVTPPHGAEIALLERVKKFWCALGFGSVTMTTPENHDRVIAYTSQLAHVASSAYIKSPTALDHIGFSAGSYKDLTRVAKLDPAMWTELFLENRDNLLAEVDGLIAHLAEYRNALEQKDEAGLRTLLAAGREQKLEADRKDYRPCSPSTSV